MEKSDDLHQDNDDGQPERRDHVAPDGAQQDPNIQSQSRNLLSMCQLLQRHRTGPQFEPHTRHLNMREGPIRVRQIVRRNAGYFRESATIDYNPNKQALLELMQILRSPPSPVRQQRVLQILESNPGLARAFFRKRQLDENARRRKQYIRRHQAILTEAPQNGPRRQAMTSQQQAQRGGHFKQPNPCYDFFAEHTRYTMQNQYQRLLSILWPQGIMGPPPNALPVTDINRQQQQFMHIVSLPPAVRSPQPNPSPSNQQLHGLLQPLEDPAALVEECIRLYSQLSVLETSEIFEQ